MGKKYLDTKENSLESSVFNILHGIQEEVTVEASGDKEAYKKFFDKALKKFKIDSPADLKGDEAKKKFYDYIDKNWKADHEEEVKVDEAADIDGRLKSYREHRKKLEAARVKRDAAKLDEGKMSQLHQYIKDGKKAAWIAKEMGLDVKTIKALMAGYEQMAPESFEIGTEKYLKHTVATTPGQKEWKETVTKKTSSMRETLANVWKTNEGKNPFQKDAKEALTKGVKGDKTMTGKKVAAVDTEPTIKEKKK